MGNKTNIIPYTHSISRDDREKQKKHRSYVLWFTGLSGSGKSTIADKVEQYLHTQNIHTYLLDGDNVRTGLNKGLGFSNEDRRENIRRIAEVAKLFVDAGIVVLCAFVSPMKRDRQMAKDIIGQNNFIEIFVNTSLLECERRDVKGLYKKARQGKIADFTGISAPYEVPELPNIILNTELLSVDDAAKVVVKFLQKELNIKL